jgi:hypothetical protein
MTYEDYMALRFRSRLFWLIICLLLTTRSQAQEDPIQQRQAYLEAAGTVLTAYMKEQSGWNHYFSTVAPQQSVSEQVKPQETYRRFLEETLSRWRQIKAVPDCYGAHLLYELALYSYSVAANFHLTDLYARGALFVHKAVELAEERARYYTTQGDEYFQRAVVLAQADGCASPSPAR